MTLLQDIDQYTGRYFSQKWIRENVLKQTEEDIEKIDQEIEGEKESDDELETEE